DELGAGQKEKSSGGAERQRQIERHVHDVVRQHDRQGKAARDECEQDEKQHLPVDCRQEHQLSPPFRFAASTATVVSALSVASAVSGTGVPATSASSVVP